MAGPPARQSRWAPARGRLHEDRLVQALVLLHVPRHRPRPARHRNGRRDRRRRPTHPPVVDRSHRRDVRHVRRLEHRSRLLRHRAAPDRHADDLGLRDARVGQEPRPARRHLFHLVRELHRARDHRVRSPRPSGRRGRPGVLRGSGRRRYRLSRRRSAHHPARPTDGDHPRRTGLCRRRHGQSSAAFGALRRRELQRRAALRRFSARKLAAGRQSRGHEDRPARVRCIPTGVRCSESTCSASAARNSHLLAHDGTFGSGIHEFNGDPSTLGQYATDPRATPFQILGKPPES